MDNEHKSQMVLETPFSQYQVNEGSKLDPIDLKKHIKSPVDEPIDFNAMLSDGNPLPLGITCSHNGILSGKPGVGTASVKPYEISIIAQSPSTEAFRFSIKLLIQEAKQQEATAEKTDVDEEEYEDEVEMQNYLDQLSTFWKAHSEGLALPPLDEVLTRKVTPLDIYHLLGRFATLVVWNADDLTPATVGQEIQLPGISARYKVYDFKVALVMTPKDLFDPVRTLGDGVRTVKALIQEVKKRKWNIELAGYDKLVTATWVEVQQVNRLEKGHKIELRNYEPGQPDLDVLTIHLNLQGKRASAA